MKNLLRTAVLCAILLSFSSTYAQFRPIYQDRDSINHIQGLSFYTPAEGFVAFRFFAGYTTDSGHTFVQRPVVPTNLDVGNNTINYTFGFDPFGIKAFNKDTLLYYGDFGLEPTILYSANGGQNWKVVFHEPMHVGTTTGAIVYDVQFPQNTATGFAVQDNGVLKTTDRGRTWRMVLTQVDARLSDMAFTSELTGYVIGQNKLLKTTDGGATWYPLTVPANPEHLEFVSASVGYVITTDGTAYKTTTGGTSWTAMNQGASFRQANHVQFVSETTGYAATYPFGVYQTTNSGRNWELLKGSNVYSGRTGEGFNELFFYNSSLAWVGGDRGSLMKTDNGGGATYPAAQWNYSKAEMCATGRILLENYSANGYTYQWYRNDSLIATTYNAGYSVVSGEDVIRLVVSNGVDTDTLTRTVYAFGALAPRFTAVARDSTVCTYQQAYIDIPNSERDVTYSMCQVSNSQYCISEKTGTGGTLTFPAYARSDQDSTATYRVTAKRYTECGYKTSEVYVPIHFKRLNIPVTVVTDTICTQQLSWVTITNSLPDYRYWIDTTYSAMGTGGTIRVRFDPRKYEPPVNEAMFRTISEKVYVEYMPFGCASYGNGDVYITARATDANFDLLGYEYFTGDSLRLSNASKQAARYKWVFTDGASVDSATHATPPYITYTTVGQKLVKLFSYTKEGCVDSASRTIEIFSKTAVPHWNRSELTYSTQAKHYFRLRDLHEDQYGNIYLAGARYELDLSGRFGTFVAKLDKNRNEVWRLTQKSYNWYEFWNMRQHLVIEQVVSDDYGYSYLLGHNLNNRSLKDSTNEFLLPSACSFLVKVSPKGKIVWVKSFSNKASWPYTYFSSGSLLMGKNKDLYVVTQQNRGSGEFLMNDEVISSNATRTGLILHLDEHGRLLDKSTYPSQYTNLWPFYDSNDDLDHLPKGVYDNNGRLVFYTELNPAEISGNQVDDARLLFDVWKVQTALIYFDTAQKKIVDVKPIYLPDATGVPVSAQPLAFALDSDGSYYASHWEYINVLPSTLNYAYIYRDTSKPRTTVMKYDAGGSLVWRKMMEGLQGSNLEVVNDKLLVVGDNFPTLPTNCLASNFYNVSRQYSSVKKITAIGDPGSYDAAGVTGEGSVDMVMARLNTATGSVATLDTYGNEMEQSAFVLKKGYGDQLYFSGQGNLRGDNIPYVADSMVKLYLYKVQGESASTITYIDMPRFVKFDNFSQARLCIDSMVHLNWSQHGVQAVKLFYSTNNGTNFSPLAERLNAEQLTYSFAPDSTMSGRVLFRIEDGDRPALFDTLSFEIAFKPVTPVIKPEPGSATLCGITPVVLAVDSTKCPTCTYTWSTGTTGASISVSQAGTYVVRANTACGMLSSYQVVTSAGTASLSVSASATSVCQGTPVTLTAAGGQSYQWSGPGLRDSLSGSVMAYPPAAGKATYIVTAQTGGCTLTRTTEITVTQAPPPAVQIGYSGCPGNRLTFQVTAAINAGSAPRYNWFVNDRDMGSANSFTSDTLRNGTTVYCMMTSDATCVSPKTARSNNITISCLTTAVPDVDGVESLIVAPNPSEGAFLVRLKMVKPKRVSFKVLDHTGRLMYQSRVIYVSGTYDHYVDLRHLSGGMYYLETTMAGRTVTEKIIIHR